MYLKYVPHHSCGTYIGNRRPLSQSPSSPLAFPCPASPSPLSPPPESLWYDSCRLFSQPLVNQSESHPGRRKVFFKFISWMIFKN